MDYDVTIIGAGPAGSILAETLAKNGYDVLILEEHSEVGSPQHCTGKITVNALKELLLEPEGVLNKVRGAVFHSPDMKAFTVESGTAQAYILDRGVFDKWLSKRATKAGAYLLTKTRAIGASVSSTAVKVSILCKEKSDTITSRVVVGADGASSNLAHWLGLYDKKLESMRMGIQIEVRDICEVEPDFVEVYFGKKYSPGFFAWIVPIGADRARVGLCVDMKANKSASKCLEEFIRNHPIAREKLSNCTHGELIAHMIPTGGPLQRTVFDGILIVGDAAGQVKSTTGGGLYYGMLCATMAGKVLSKALKVSESQIIHQEALIDYERLWRERFEKEIAFSVRTRSFLDSLTDNEVNYFFKIFREDDSIREMVKVEGDIDWQSKVTRYVLQKVLRKLAMRPRILYKLGTSLLL